MVSRLFWLVTAVALLLSALCLAAWIWAGTPGALNTTLQLLNQVLPASQHLLATDVQGNLRRGGHIGHLQWHANGVHIEAKHAEFSLDWAWFGSEPWPLKMVKIEHLSIQSEPNKEPLHPLEALLLPFPVQMDVHIARLSWTGSTAIDLSDLQAQYHFDGQQHDLNMRSLAMAKGQYNLRARLQGAAPMALDVSANGLVQTSVPGTGATLPLVVSAAVQGQLSGLQSQLSVQLQVQPDSAHGKTVHKPDHVKLDLRAQIQPWQTQPLRQVKASWQNLDAATVWPSAPQTRLNGQAALEPDGQTWRVTAHTDNLEPGPWSMAQLPLRQLTLNAHYQLQQWQILPSLAVLPSGRVQFQGQQTAQGWTGQVQLKDIIPAHLHTDWPLTVLHGSVNAQNVTPHRIDLRADLEATSASLAQAPAAAAKPKVTLNWQSLQLQGSVQEQEWDITRLHLKAQDASLVSQFKLHGAQRSVSGQMDLKLPGLQAQAQGLIAPRSGQGSLNVQLQNAELAQAWLAQLPLAWLQALQGKAQGKGSITAQWQGGFLQDDATLQLQAQWPKLTWQSGQDTPWQLQTGQLTLQGSPLKWQAQLHSRVARDRQEWALDTTWSARHAANSQTWQGQIDQFSLASAQTTASSPWRLNLQQALPWQIQITPFPQLNWQASQWWLQGPTPGKVKLSADAGQWQKNTAQQTQAHWAARFDQLPLQWVFGALGQDVSTDVLLEGSGQLHWDPTLRVQARLQRSSGDILIASDASSRQRLPAGLRLAKAVLSIEQNKAQVNLDWDSQRLGQAQAQIQTTLDTGSEGWKWSEQAPLNGWIQANLPQLGAWSVFAPPGWRVQGTLNARLDLSGTRQQANWQGHLQADQLAARSSVAGIEFKDGQLRARMQGQEMVLERLSFRGAGADGGTLEAHGRLQLASPWFSPSAEKAAKLWEVDKLSLQIDTQALRVSNRADRRLSITGQMTGIKEQGPLRIRGTATAEQALFILPKNSTPRLDDDVRVLNPAQATAPPIAPTERNPFTPSWLGTPDVHVQLSLGPDFQIQGQGIDSRLSGQLQWVSNPQTQGTPKLQGEVHTVGGRYQAQDQLLDIDSGVLKFTGPYDNPALDIIALRPNLTQRVGVQVSGTALLPRIRLYAEPDMPDADKLAWLVLGRSAAGGGAESAVLQQATMALLSGDGKSISGGMANAFGLDEVSLASGSRADQNATGAAITLGKRLSKDFYLAYESSLSGTFGSLFVFYDLSQRLTLRAQAGVQSALDLIFTVRKD